VVWTFSKASALNLVGSVPKLFKYPQQGDFF